MAMVQKATHEIKEDQWIPFLDEFTRENRGAHARLEILGGELGYQVEAEDRPFQGVSADLKDGERTVWISLGATPEDHHTHGIHGVKVIRWLPADGISGAILELESQDDTKTILTLTPPPDYALPDSERHA